MSGLQHGPANFDVGLHLCQDNLLQAGAGLVIARELIQ